MKTSILNQWFSGDEAKAICWTLIHSLWIGLIIALLCGIVIAATRKSAAALRYRLLCGLLLLFVCAIGVTYYLEARTAPAYNVVGYAQNIFVKAPANVVANPLVIPQNQTFFDNVQAFLNQNANVIVLVWLLFFVLKSLKMVSGLLYIQRIRHYKISDVTEELKHKIELFSNQIGVRRVVRLVQSELVKVPVAVGWLKPMILLPVGIAFQLTPEQLDGILWHELAHIRRRDYLVNILQGLVETVFFFNPGLLWLSSLIRTEREACCDDMVLSRMNRKANYLEALLSFGYGEFSQARYAMSIGSGNQLRDRLKRMISQENKRLSVAEKSVLAVGLVLLSAFTTISKDNPVIKHFTVKYTNKSGKAISKSMTVSMHLLPEGQRVNDSKPNSRAKDTIIVTDTAIRFTSVLFKHGDADWVNNDISAKDDKGNIYHFIVVDGKIASMELNGAKIAESKLPDYEYTLQLIVSELMEKRRVRDADNAGYKAKSPAAKFKDGSADKFAKQKFIDDQKAGAITSKQNDDQRYIASEPEAMAMKVQAMRKRMEEDSISYTEQQQRAYNVIADLVKEKVVPRAASVKWFGLSNTELIVNGQKQSDEMQQRYKAKYGIYDGNGLYYGPVQMHGKGIFIDATAANERMPRLPRQPKAPHGPNYKGAIKPRYTADSIAWENQQLIRQQQLFAADQAAKRQKLIQQQQIFSADQASQREQIISKQRLLLADQQKQLEGLQRRWITKAGIDLQPVIASVIADLVNANVISDKSDLIKFNLTNSALMVNGKKQPEGLHEKLKAKYLEQPNYSMKSGIADDPNFGLHFNAQSGARGLGITEGPDSP
jgi:bla regulator protein BlaR1